MQERFKKTFFFFNVPLCEFTKYIFESEEKEIPPQNIKIEKHLNKRIGTAKAGR